MKAIFKYSTAIITTTLLSFSAHAYTNEAGNFEIGGGGVLYNNNVSQPMNYGRTNANTYGGNIVGKYFVTDIIGIGLGLDYISHNVSSFNKYGKLKTRNRRLSVGPMLSVELPLTERLNIEGVVGLKKVMSWDRISLPSYGEGDSGTRIGRSTFSRGWGKSIGVNLKLAINDSVSLVLGCEYNKVKIGYNNDNQSRSLENQINSNIGLVVRF